MRGRVTVFLLLLSFLGISSAVPQCSYTNAFSWPFRASYFDVAADLNGIWATTGYGVQLLTRAASLPSIAQTAMIPGLTRAAFAPDFRRAYVGSGSSIYVIDNPQSGPPSYSIKILGSVDAGATVNDIVVSGGYLYAATSNGLQQFDLLSPAAPKQVSVIATSSPNVLSLSLAGSTLYAADGDSSVEIFDVVIPNLVQKTGSLQSLPHSIAVHAVPARVYVSDGLRTDVFVGAGASAVKAGTVSFGSTSFAQWQGDTAVFVAGSDRRFHALDWTNAAAPVELFAYDIAPSGGTINRIGSLVVSGSSLFVAAGDAGLQTWDVSGFTPPFAVRSYSTGATSSVLWADVGGERRLYAARTGGGISEFTKSSTGALTAARQWDSRVHILLDSGNGFLLSSTGPLLTYWTLTAATPVLISSAQLRSGIVSAVAVGTTAYVVLDDRSLWSVDLSQTSPVPQAICGADACPAKTISGTNPSSIARSGNAIAIVDLRDDGTTAISYFASPDFTKTPQTVLVPGVSTTGVALSGSTAAVFTFRGITLVDFASGSTTVVPQSNTDVARGLAFNGTQLVELTDSSIRVWDTATNALVREFQLPAGGTSLSVGPIAAVSTASGVAGVVLDSTSAAPRLVSTFSGNAYYKKIAAAADRLYLFDGRSIDIFSTTFGAAPHYISSVRPPGIVDFAVSPTALFTVASSKAVAAWSSDGAPLAQATLNEGSDVQPLAIAVAGGVPWIAISKGCLTGSCQKQTAILDPRSLVRTALIDGAIVDATTTGNRAWAIFDLPAEIRSYDLTDPLHPSPLASRAAEGSATPVSVADANGTLYVLGEKLYVYSDSNLAKSGEQFASYQPDLAGAFAYVDQRIRIDANCGFVSGRSASPQLFSVPQWTSLGGAPAVPASVRSVAATPGRLYVLTDDSVEVWTTQPPAFPSRRHAAR